MNGRLGGLSSRAIVGRFYKTLEETPKGWEEAISFENPSDQESETYKFLGQSPAMREWVGGRQAKGLRENGLTIENKKFEATLEVDVDDIERDKTGQIMRRVDDLAVRSTVGHKKSLLSTLIQNAETTACYDGQYFYSATHSEGDSGTQSNSISVDISAVPTNNHGSTTAPSPGEMMHAIMEAIQAMLGFVDDQGQPMNEDATRFLIMVPTTFWKVARTAVGAQNIDGNDTNILAVVDDFEINVAVNPRLNTWTDKFATFRLGTSVAPFIWQVEQEAKMQAVAEDSELEFNEDVWHFGVKAKGNAGYGYWQHSVLTQLV